MANYFFQEYDENDESILFGSFGETMIYISFYLNNYETCFISHEYDKFVNIVVDIHSLNDDDEDDDFPSFDFTNCLCFRDICDKGFTDIEANMILNKFNDFCLFAFSGQYVCK